MSDIYKTFKKYIDNTAEDSLIITNTDSEGCREFIKLLPERNFVTFGLNDADYVAKNIEFNGFSSKFDIYCDGEFRVKMELSVPGIHNVYNALAVFAALDLKGFHPEEMLEHFKTFTGMGRRFQKVTDFNGVNVYDDYAHHPEEIGTTLQSVASYEGGRVVAIFQPHRFTRLKSLWNDFLNVFNTVDKIFVTDVFHACEEPIDGINSENFVKELKNEDKTYVGGDMQTVAEKIYPTLRKGDLVITLGAGTVTQIGGFLKKLSEN